jgi:hypothetical protein
MTASFTISVAFVVGVEAFTSRLAAAPIAYPLFQLVPTQRKAITTLSRGMLGSSHDCLDAGHSLTWIVTRSEVAFIGAPGKRTIPLEWATSKSTPAFSSLRPSRHARLVVSLPSTVISSAEKIDEADRAEPFPEKRIALRTWTSVEPELLNLYRQVARDDPEWFQYFVLDVLMVDPSERNAFEALVNSPQIDDGALDISATDATNRTVDVAQNAPVEDSDSISPYCAEAAVQTAGGAEPEKAALDSQSSPSVLIQHLAPSNSSRVVNDTLADPEMTNETKSNAVRRHVDSSVSSEMEGVAPKSTGKKPDTTEVSAYNNEDSAGRKVTAPDHRLPASEDASVSTPNTARNATVAVVNGPVSTIAEPEEILGLLLDSPSKRFIDSVNDTLRPGRRLEGETHTVETTVGKNEPTIESSSPPSPNGPITSTGLPNDNDDVLVIWTTLKGTRTRKFIPLANVKRLGYSTVDIESMKEDILEIVLRDSIERPKTGVPDRWMQVNGSPNHARIGKKREIDKAKRQDGGADTLVGRQGEAASRSVTDSASREHKPTTQRVNPYQGLSSMKGAPAGAEGKRIYDGRSSGRKRDPSKSMPDPPPPKSPLWVDMDSFRDLLRAEAGLRLRILGDDWTDVVKEESEWRLNLYRNWLWTLYDGIGNPLVESRSDRIRRQNRAKNAEQEKLGPPWIGGTRSRQAPLPRVPLKQPSPAKNASRGTREINGD